MSRVPCKIAVMNQNYMFDCCRDNLRRKYQDKRYNMPGTNKI
jgi:hypothetical protein